MRMSEAMTPYGLALVEYFERRTSAAVTIRRDDGVEASLPVRHYFREPSEFTPIEVAALDHCCGEVLDVGAGAGIHSLALQSRSLPVTAIDISPQAVAIMLRRGVRVAHRADIFDCRGGPFDTLVLLGHGIAMVEDLAGLDAFLVHARELTRAGGQILLDLLDVGRSREAANLAYHEANRRAGRYIGEIRLQVEVHTIAPPPSSVACHSASVASASRPSTRYCRARWPWATRLRGSILSAASAAQATSLFRSSAAAWIRSMWKASHQEIRCSARMSAGASVVSR